MFKTRTIVGADFCRDGHVTSIEVFLSDSKVSTSLYNGLIDHCIKELSKNEIDTVIQLLLTKKERMSREGDFPHVYGEMLSDLFTAYKERYGKQVPKGENMINRYILSMNQLAELLEKLYTFKEVRIDSVIAGSSESDTTKVNVGPEGILFVSFSEVEEDDMD